MIIDMIFRFFSYTKQEKRLREQRRLVPSKPFPTCPRRPYLFRLAGTNGGEKGRWGTFGAYCGCDSGRNLIFSCCEHTKPPYVRYGTRRLLWYTDFSSSCDSISAAKSLAFETCRVVRIRRSSFWCRTGAGAPLASPGGSWLRSEAGQTDEGLCSCICKPRHKFMLLHCMHSPTGF